VTQNNVTNYDTDNVIMAFISFKGQVMNMLHRFRLTFFPQKSLHPLAKRLIKTWSSQRTWRPIYTSLRPACLLLLQANQIHKALRYIRK